jgi:hypothetical protein
MRACMTPAIEGSPLCCPPGLFGSASIAPQDLSKADRAAMYLSTSNDRALEDDLAAAGHLSML